MQKKGDEAEEVQDTAEGVSKKAFTKYPHLRSTYIQEPDCIVQEELQRRNHVA